MGATPGGDLRFFLDAFFNLHSNKKGAIRISGSRLLFLLLFPD
jgi:hypothetical protein